MYVKNASYAREFVQGYHQNRYTFADNVKIVHVIAPDIVDKVKHSNFCKATITATHLNDLTPALIFGEWITPTDAVTVNANMSADEVDVSEIMMKLI
jgi:hypothetical protein